MVKKKEGRKMGGSKFKCCITEKIDDPKKKAIVDKINGIGFALFITMIGGLLLVPKGILPGGTWLIGVGLIMIGSNIARLRNDIRLYHCTLVLGIILLIAGIMSFSYIKIPIFPILLIVIGVSLIRGLIAKKKQ